MTALAAQMEQSIQAVALVEPTQETAALVVLEL
jgi:hypothetical protein